MYVFIIFRIKILYLGFYMRMQFVNFKYFINISYQVFVICRLKIWIFLETMNLIWYIEIILMNELFFSGLNVMFLI